MIIRYLYGKEEGNTNFAYKTWTGWTTWESREGNVRVNVERNGMGGLDCLCLTRDKSD